jgi:S-sulfo-L-cysteine synthase (O-acetyl-L-serine-dependent)
MRTESRAIELGSSLEDRIGNTPLIRFDRLVRGVGPTLDGITLLAKAEWYNP